QLIEADLHFDIGLLLLSFGLLTIWMLGQVWIWHLLTRTVQVEIPFPRAMTAWFYSQLGKYIPGKIFLYLGRLHFYVREGRPAGPVTLAFGVEFVGNLAAAVFTVLVAGLTLDVPGFDRFRWLLVAAMVAFLTGLHPRPLGWLIAGAARLLRRQPFPVTLTYPQLLRYLALYVMNWLLFGGTLFVFIRSFYLVEPSSILYLTGAFSLAGMIGILAFFTPSGLGVREGVLALFLNQVMPTSVAIVASVASRIWLTVVELVGAGLVYLAVRFWWHDLDQAKTLRSIGGGLESLEQ
ncbi:MAG TPA: lysylphosphatidylglycerol synthase domain-containing protein, partial [Acidimicrobiia bacterium]